MVSYAAIGCTEFPPHISYTQSSFLGWHDTEGPAWKEVKKLLTFAPDTEHTSSCSCSEISMSFLAGNSHFENENASIPKS